MPGGLLNIISYGSENIILNGNPSKTFFKQTYKKYTNFGLQRFRIDFEGQRVLNYDSPSHFTFKIPRYAELLWDTYIVVQLPNIYSSLYLYAKKREQIFYENFMDLPKWNETVAENTENELAIEIPSGDGIKKPKMRRLNGGSDYFNASGIENAVQEFKFKWIENLGFNMIKEIVIKSNSNIIEKYSGETMLLINERDNNTKKELINNMIGNIPSLTDPGIKAGFESGTVGGISIQKKRYPTCINDLSGEDFEPSIRGRKLYIPLLSWFSKSSKNAFPLIALQYSDLEIDITFRPVSELYTLYDKDKDIFTENILKKFDVDVSPRYFGTGDSNPNQTQIKNFLSPPDKIVNRPQTNIWNSDIHLISTYVFLSNEERKIFAAKNHEYLLKNIYEYQIKNAMGSERVEIPSKNLVSGYIFRFRRSDVDIRNQWSNYSNWAYDNKSPINLKFINCNDINNNYGYRLSPYLGSSNANTQYLVTENFGINNPIMCTGKLEVPSSNKIILKNMSILFNGTPRENILDNGIYNYIEKYNRTTGSAKEGIYVYNFSIHSNRNDYQPSGSQNMNKTKTVVFEFNTEVSELIESVGDTQASFSDLTNAQIDIENTITAIRQNDNNKYENSKYDYELFIVEERYNILYIKNGLVELKYAR